MNFQILEENHIFKIVKDKYKISAIKILKIKDVKSIFSHKEKILIAIKFKIIKMEN